VVISGAGLGLRSVEMVYTATKAATAAVTMMAMSFLLRSLLGAFVARAFGFEAATLGRFLARSIFRCRLVGTKREPAF
jgi:hypothetical protein